MELPSAIPYLQSIMRLPYHTCVHVLALMRFSDTKLQEKSEKWKVKSEKLFVFSSNKDKIWTKDYVPLNFSHTKSTENTEKHFVSNIEKHKRDELHDNYMDDLW